MRVLVFGLAALRLGGLLLARAVDRVSTRACEAEEHEEDEVKAGRERRRNCGQVGRHDLLHGVSPELRMRIARDHKVESEDRCGNFGLETEQDLQCADTLSERATPAAAQQTAG